jgi:dTDP-4-amino-4,6-dideoxygalactose transaminase
MPERLELVDLGALYADVRAEIDAAIADVCERSAFVGGAPVRRFEKDFGAYTGARHCIGVGNGTDALQLALMAAQLPAGSRVVVPANTFVATAEAVVAARLEPVFADVLADSGLLDVQRLDEVVDERVSAIVPVHLYGRLVDMDALCSYAADRHLFVLEDAAQAHAARRGGRHAGTFGNAGTFSFYPGKNLGAFGDGGAVVTDDDGLADRIRTLRDHGRRGRDHHAVVGVNSRLDGLQAAVLSAKLPHLDRWTRERRRAAELYRSELDASLLDWAGDGEPGSESNHLFPILVDDRDRLADVLRAEGVATGVHYRSTVPSSPAFGARSGAFSNAEMRAARQLSLPMHPYLSDDDVLRVCALVNSEVAAAI